MPRCEDVKESALDLVQWLAPCKVLHEKVKLGVLQGAEEQDHKARRGDAPRAEATRESS
jgi:hypothetical protein